MKPKTHFSGRPRTPFGLLITIFGVAFNGLMLIIGTLFAERHLGNLRFASAIFSLPILAGLTLFYLSSLLARRKQTAWAIALPLYSFVLGLNLMRVLLLAGHHHFALLTLLDNFILPLVIMASLFYYRLEFTVKSDLASFRQSLAFVFLILSVAFVYGTLGFTLMDKHDFHHEISLPEAMHRTIDQFGLTTKSSLKPYSRRARVFVDSLSVVSVGAVAYGIVSLFQPIRARLIDQSRSRAQIKKLLDKYRASSEDFFKLWPHDKQYFLTSDGEAGLALHVRHGIALVSGDPAGQKSQFPLLIKQFCQVCYGNDWRPAFIHTAPEHNKLYTDQGFSVQKIGEEAVLDLEHFQKQVANNKYFRHINNKFIKLGYTTEFIRPPYEKKLLESLRRISIDWLAQPGRVERGLMMGYFSTSYLQQCNLMVLRSSKGTIQAFMNQVPSFDKDEANFDLLRHKADSPGNINDFLLMGFIEQMRQQGFIRLNLGLCPLAGLDKKDADYSIIDSTLRFAYANGDKLYSFRGLNRFKAKYEPSWSSRYIVYTGGIRGFTKTLNALNSAMKVRRVRSAPSWWPHGRR